MQQTSELYNEILVSKNYRIETILKIKVGNSYMIVDENDLISMSVTRRTFENNKPEVGCCVCGEINIEMYEPTFDIPKRAELRPCVRLVSNENEEVHSEWLNKGVFYLDTRDVTQNNDNLNIMTIHGYDAMIMTEQIYANSTMEFPASDINMVNDIALKIGVGVEEHTLELLVNGYNVQLPIQYTYREILGFIGGMYAGNWIMNDNGELQLISLYEIPPESNLLIDEAGYFITFGTGDNAIRILLKEGA